MTSRHRRKLYQRVMKDFSKHGHRETITAVSGIIGEVIDGVWKDNTPLHLAFTTGELRKVSGFYTDHDIVSELTAVWIARFSRHAAISCGLDPADLIATDALTLLYETDDLQEECVQPIIDKVVEQYGRANVDKQAIDAFNNKIKKWTERVTKILNGEEQ